MKKLRKALKALIAIIKNPWLLNKVLSDDRIWQNYLIKKHHIHNGLPMIDLHQLSGTVSESVVPFAFLGGGSLPTDMALLKILCKRFPKCTYFEIGTWRGESVVNVAQHAEECYTLNLSKSEILALGLSEAYADLHGFFSKEKKNIIHLSGDSLTYDFQSLNKKFDLIFIDGNHHYDYVKKDTENIFKHLVHEHSIVVWHDYAYTPEKLRPEILAAMLDGIPAAYQNHLYHVSNTLCAVFIREEFTTRKFESPMTPNAKFKVTIEQVS